MPVGLLFDIRMDGLKREKEGKKQERTGERGLACRSTRETHSYSLIPVKEAHIEN